MRLSRSAAGRRAALLGLLLAAALSGACAESGGPKKAGPGEQCAKPKDCVYGTECREKQCALISFSDCDGDTTPSGGSQCLSGQKCRDGHCTVQCVGTAECKEGQVCRIGVCVKGNKDLRQCSDNRDCPWPETCFYGQCATRSDGFRCVSDIDCGAGYRCVNGRCI
jgi:hypothetical protein